MAAASDSAARRLGIIRTLSRSLECERDVYQPAFTLHLQRHRTAGRQRANRVSETLQRHDLRRVETADDVGRLQWHLAARTSGARHHDNAVRIPQAFG